MTMKEIHKTEPTTELQNALKDAQERADATCASSMPSNQLDNPVKIAERARRTIAQHHDRSPRE